MPTPIHHFAILPRLPWPKAGLSGREVMGIWHGHRTFYPRISTPGYSSHPCQVTRLSSMDLVTKDHTQIRGCLPEPHPTGHFPG